MKEEIVKPRSRSRYTSMSVLKTYSEEIKSWYLDYIPYHEMTARLKAMGVVSSTVTIRKLLFEELKLSKRPSKNKHGSKVGAPRIYASHEELDAHIDLIRSLHKQGYKYTQMARHLTNFGVPSSNRTIQSYIFARDINNVSKSAEGPTNAALFRELLPTFQKMLDDKASLVDMWSHFTNQGGALSLGSFKSYIYRFLKNKT